MASDQVSSLSLPFLRACFSALRMTRAIFFSYSSWSCSRSNSSVDFADVGQRPIGLGKVQHFALDFCQGNSLALRLQDNLSNQELLCVSCACEAAHIDNLTTRLALLSAESPLSRSMTACVLDQAPPLAGFQLFHRAAAKLLTLAHRDCTPSLGERGAN
jgi:hypothetical protein